MNRDFVQLYNQELGLLSEHARAFAEEYPGIAERLGGITADRMDPMVGGLLEGAAFLAARVQLKLKHEFPEFTNNLLETLVPNYLAPTPSCLLARFMPVFGDPALLDGRRIDARSAIDAVYVERERRVVCRFTLAGAVTLWPLEVTDAKYITAVAGIHALGVEVPANAASALKITLRLRTLADAAEEPSQRASLGMPEAAIAGCGVDELPVHLMAPEQDAVQLLEQLIMRRVSVQLRSVDEFDRPVVCTLPADCIEQTGFDEQAPLLGEEHRLFRGFSRLQEYFTFPRMFMGFRLKGLRKYLSGMVGNTVDVIIILSDVHTRLASLTNASSFALFATPAVNLFEKQTDRVPLKTSAYEHIVMADRSHPIDYEIHRILDVQAHPEGAAAKLPVLALYAGSAEKRATDSGMRYTIRRMPRLRTSRERQTGLAADYLGSETYLSLSSTETTGGVKVQELSVRALCSNRHLPEHLPMGQGGADFRLVSDSTHAIEAHFGPTRPRDAMAYALHDKRESETRGAIAWRLINMLALNQRGIALRTEGDTGAGLREVLALFSIPADVSSERRVKGVRSVTTRPAVRRMSERIGVGVARGLAIAVTVDEKAFEGSGAFLLGSVLDRFLSEYATINQFTQLTLHGVDRGQIATFPVRVGGRRQL